MLHNYYIYILLCSDDSYYVGVTNEVEERVHQHNTGIDPTCYTYTRRPVVLKYTEEYKYIYDAIAREKQLKGWSRKKKEALIRGDIKELKRLSNHNKALRQAQDDKPHSQDDIPHSQDNKASPNSVDN